VSWFCITNFHFRGYSDRGRQSNHPSIRGNIGCHSRRPCSQNRQASQRRVGPRCVIPMWLGVSCRIQDVVGLMGNIVDGIQRPLRVSRFMSSYSLIDSATWLSSPSKNSQSPSISHVVSTPKRLIVPSSGISLPHPLEYFFYFQLQRSSDDVRRLVITYQGVTSSVVSTRIRLWTTTKSCFHLVHLVLSPALQKKEVTLSMFVSMGFYSSSEPSITPY
jgi:hypothetical protein